MLPKVHIIAGLIFSSLIFFVFPQITWFGALIIFMASFLIDTDHYMYYVYRKKNWSIKKAYSFFVKNKDLFLGLKKQDREKYKKTLVLFHGLECLIVIGLLMFLNKIFLFVLIGMVFHLILDFWELHIYDIPLSYKTSQIYTYIKNKKKAELVLI